MKKIFLLIFLAAPTFSFAQLSNAVIDPLERNWYNADSSMVLSIIRDAQDELFYGKIIWLKNAVDANGKPRLDAKNKDKSFRKEPLMNMIILGKLRKSENRSNMYEHGFFYDPDKGKQSCIEIEWLGEKLRVFVFNCMAGIVGKYTEWTAAK